ncbi:MAG: IS66 family insertion sequence element accessory protein TnpA [Peptoniphilus grossensis]|uniref:IS66 family insertion sequence element accessory protein TnpA n=1 Tax=Anaerococcus vaginalis TaxID=33037 RepID=UPI001DFDEA7C|nr:transposase [Anaerococcus vaginalis]MBS4889424.1 helix-turn-helix domain-containing protein [Anaerococcus vaginalis]
MARAKYQEWLKEENLIKVEAWAKSGLSEKQISQNMGIAYSTLKEWKKKYSALSASLKKGKEVTDFEVENAMHKSSLGYYVEETKTYITETNGVQTKKIEKYKKWIPPNSTSQIFWLKNRKPDVWMDRKAKDNDNKNDSELVKYFELLDDRLLEDE